MLPSLSPLMLVFTGQVVAAAFPGPTNIRIMGVAMHQGRQAALVLAAGVITGSMFWGMMAATGLSAVLMCGPTMTRLISGRPVPDMGRQAGRRLSRCSAFAVVADTDTAGCARTVVPTCGLVFRP